NASHELTKSGATLGTPGYMAPEQARGTRDLDARTDVFSLGCVLFRCITGNDAFTGDHVIAVLAKLLLEDSPRVADLCPDVPSALAALIDRTLSKDPAHRPADAAAVAAELAALGPLADEVPFARMAKPHSAGLTVAEQRLSLILLVGIDVATFALEETVEL